MARLNTIGEMMVHEGMMIVDAGAHTVFTCWTRSRVILNPPYNCPKEIRALI
jgi:hypothetical protein